MPEIAESLASIPIPQEFFRDLLPRVRDLSELKVTLFVFQLGAAAGKPGVPLSVLSDPRVVKAVVGTESPEPLEERFAVCWFAGTKTQPITWLFSILPVP